ncbi:hypothetical protein IAT38_005505 [Cryptococcus sp. DSM 104549]
MSATQPAQSSVFNALGSYADRIKDANGNPVKTTSSPSTLAPSSTTRTSSASPSVSKDRDAKPSPAAQAQPQPAAEDDGPWETVQSRQRQRPEEKRGGSSSKNWRDRSSRDDSKEKTGEDGEKRSGSHVKGSKKGANNSSSSTAPVSSTAEKAPSSSARPAPVAPALSTTKAAWGAVPPMSQPAAASTTAPTATPAPAVSSNKEQAKEQSSTVPSSPSLNGTTLPGSVNSPNPSSEAASTATAVSKTAEAGEEGSWRARPPPAASPAAATPAKVEEPAPRQPAPPPAVNVWDLRKKTAAPAAAAPAPVKAVGEKAMANGHAHGHAHGKEEGAKGGAKKKSAAAAVGSAAALPPIHDATLWPDVAQAAETVKASEDKKEKVREKTSSETASVEETAATGKKPKWTPIPASELLAAADQAAENNRRQSRLEAKKRSATKGEGETSVPPTKGTKPRKSAATGAGATEAKKGGKSAKTGEGEIRLPPQPQGQRDGSQPGFKPVFGTVDASTELGVASATAPAASGSEAKKENKPETEVKSSRASQRGASPSRPAAEAASASSAETSRAAPQSKPMTGSTTAPLPQHNFNPASNPNLPRPPRGRDGRGSFNGRGRGGFRSTSAIAHKGHPYTSPPMGVTGLPVEGMVYPGGAAANGNLFARGYGMGFQPFYPAASYGQPGMYEAMQTQYGNMGVYGRGVTMPPPPMPQTMIPNLDSLRFYVLGQVEYYFSMQNLAMDFFLRQQMDSEGWIDISMIASFNRVKSLTPDIAVVRECMTLSSFLEVREDKVRISGADSHRWVLPDARPSTFGADPRSPSGTTDASRELSAGAPVDAASASGEGATGLDGQQQTPAQVQRGFVAQEVENALMKSSLAVSAAASTTNGDEKTETVTPATSMSGDGAKEDEGGKETAQ